MNPNLLQDDAPTEADSAKLIESTTSLQPSGSSKSVKRSESATSDDPILNAVTSIEALPNEVLDYIFSFLNFIERLQVVLVCGRWLQVGSCPTKLALTLEIFPNRNLNDYALCSILARFGPTLKELAIERNPDLTSESLCKIGEHCPNLVALELHLVGSPQIICLKSLALGCPHLKIIKLENEANAPDTTASSATEVYDMTFLLLFYDTYRKTYNEGLLAIAQNCKGIEGLYVSNLTLVNPRWLDAINPKLRSLCLYDTLLSFRCMQSLISRCHELEEFVLDDCTLLDKKILLKFLKHFQLTLKALVIKWQGFYEMDWREGLNGMVNLEILHLLNCSGIDDDLMEALANECSKLRFLDIGCCDVTDLGLIVLERLPVLKELRIGPVSKIQGFGLGRLVSKGILQQVTVPVENSALQEACRNMAAEYPNVRFIVKAKERLMNEWWNELDTNDDVVELPQEFLFRAA